MTSRPLMIVLSAFLLVSCGPLLELPGSGPAPALYTLTPVGGTSARDGDWTLMIEEPGVPGGLRTDFIAVRTSPNRYEFLDNARWVDTLPRLVNGHMLQSFEMRSRGRAISDASIDIPADYRLKIDVRAFNAVSGSAGADGVEVKILVKLVRNGPVQIIAEKMFESALATAPGNADATVAALDAAARDVVDRVITWVDAELAGS